LKIVLDNEELTEIVKNWAEKKFNQNAQISIANKKNGIEITVNLTDKVFKIPEDMYATGCCGVPVEEKLEKDMPAEYLPVEEVTAAEKIESEEEDNY